MNRLGSQRALTIVFALAAVAFIASGVPDNKGTDAAIGWFAFLALALVFLVLAGAGVVRRLPRKQRRAGAAVPASPTNSKEIT